MIYLEGLEPYHDLVVVRRVDYNKTPSGLVLPQPSKGNESHLAKIVSVGPGIDGRPETKPKCVPGEYFLIARFIGTIIPINGIDHTIVKWADCQARVTLSDATRRLLDESLEDTEITES